MILGQLKDSRDQTRVRKTILLLIVCLLATTVFGQQPVVATDTNALKQQLQIKLDEWHKAGKFPGATLGVVLANGESFSLAVGYSDRDRRKRR